MKSFVNRTRVKPLLGTVWLVWLGACSNGVLNSGSSSGSKDEEPGEGSETVDGEVDTEDTETTASLSPGDTGADTAHECLDGALYDGICWFLGDLNQSCPEVCEPYGSYHPETPRYVGSEEQGGSFDACYDILVALRRTGVLRTGFRDDGLGLGCHLWDEEYYWWLATPDFDPSHKTYSARVVCGCILE